jgi:hypothetical protein
MIQQTGGGKMKVIRQTAKPVSVFLTILMLIITVPFDSVFAAMVGTEATLDLTRAKQARDKINKLLLREDVKNALMAQGIDPLEAKARIDTLSDAEVIQIADEIDKLPAGGAIQVVSTTTVILIGIVVVLIIVGIIVGIAFLAKSVNK